MKFIVDEQLPFKLAIWLRQQGYDAFHISTLVSGDSISDDDICRISMNEERTVITKDADFWETYLIKQQPYKLLYITTGNISNKDLITLFIENFSIILELLNLHKVVELSYDELKVHC